MRGPSQDFSFNKKIMRTSVSPGLSSYCGDTHMNHILWFSDLYSCWATKPVSNSDDVIQKP